MSVQTEPSLKQLVPRPVKQTRNETPLRERLNSKFRIKSELRGSTKMPPIVSPQMNSAIQTNQSGIFPFSKSPLRKPQPLKYEGNLSQSQENLSGDFSLTSPKALTIETGNETQNLPSLGLGGHTSPNFSSSIESPTFMLNPMTNKQNYAIPLSLTPLSTKVVNGIKNKSLSTRRNNGPKVNGLFGNRNKPYEDKRELSGNLENTDNHFIGNPFNSLPELGPTRCSNKSCGIVKAYAANTNQGIVRDYNEDRVAIIINIMKPANMDHGGDWPPCSFFGIYDGHGGGECADFLRDNLHHYIFKDRNFPFNPVEALKNGFLEAEKRFTELAQQQYEINRSGSCAIVALIVGDICYIANVGDSRAIMSCKQGKKVMSLSRDHKPSEDYERERIMANGGKVYQYFSSLFACRSRTQIMQPTKQTNSGTIFTKTLLGPHRVFPGRLSVINVSRTFGDIEAKIVKFGGIPGVVIAEPEITRYQLTDESDFIILGCDGIFDVLNNEDVVRTVWTSTRIKCEDIHQQSCESVENILIESMVQRSLDNVTAIMITLEGFNKGVFHPDSSMALEKNPSMPNKAVSSILYDNVSKAKSLAQHPLKKSFNFDYDKGNQKKSDESSQEEIQEKSSPALFPLSPTLKSESLKGKEMRFTSKDNLGTAILAKKLISVAKNLKQN